MTERWKGVPGKGATLVKILKNMKVLGMERGWEMSPVFRRQWLGRWHKM